VADDDSDGFITLPPGIADSGTLRRARPERPAIVREEIVFLPNLPGAIPVLPAPATEEVVDGRPATEEAVDTPPATEQDLGETRVSVSRHAAPAWRLVLPGGEAAVTVDGPLFLGRNPTAAKDQAGARVLPISDPAKSISKTHAVLELDGGQLWVRDLDSTNGVWVVPAGGEPIAVAPGTRVVVPAGADLELGDFVIQVEHS
jgi:hypothetical protein